GRGTMRVERVGTATELGKIAQTLKITKEPPTPLQERLKKFSLKLTYIVLALALIIFILSFVKFHLFFWSLNLAAVLAVAAIPEGLIIAVTIILVLGTQRILRRQGLVKRLLAVETLGSVTVICTDKTGTLTEGNMRVTKNDFKDARLAMLAMALCNNLEDSLEVAFWKHVQSSDGFDNTIDHKEVFPRLGEEPFSGETKFMMTTNQIDGELLTFAKGAPEVMLSMSRLSQEEIAIEQKKVDAWADGGLKVLGLAYKQGGNLKDRKDFVWLGLVGVEDPLRFGVKEAIDVCRQAHIEIKMITGDHPKTALAIAKKLGLASKPEEVIEASLLDLWSVEELREKIAGIKVLARIAPHQKMKIVEALQANGEIVAMVGDGVNDALA
ncbi:MAG: HAD-IC family P-type ATPase, partial [Patescibacteria group bacterium]